MTEENENRLEEVRRITGEITFLQNKIKSYWEMTGTRGVSYSGAGRQRGRSSGAGYEKILAKIDLCEREITSLKQALPAAVDRVEKILDAVIDNPDHRSVMHLHYIGGYSMEKVCDMCGYSRESCYRIRRKALPAIDAYLTTTGAGDPACDLVGEC